MHNYILPFTIYSHQIRGSIIKLDTVLDSILANHNYDELTSRTLINMLLAVSLLGAQFKDQITLSIELRGKENSGYIITDFQYPRFIRGFSNLNTQSLNENEFFLSITIDYQGNRYQGIVEVENLDIEKAIKKYFSQSEQVKTCLKISNWKFDDSWFGSAMMIQSLPSSSFEDEENWMEAEILFNTIKKEELVDPQIEPKKLIHNLFHESIIHVFETKNIEYKCRCSREKSLDILKTIKSSELDSLSIEGKISVDCQFCNKSHVFSKSEILSA